MNQVTGHAPAPARFCPLAIGLCLCCWALPALGQQADAPQIETAASSVVVVAPPQPKTKLQAMAEQKGAMIVGGYTDVGTVQREDGSFVRITAAQFTNTATSATAYGVLVIIHQTESGGANAHEARSFVDEDELDTILSSLDAMSKLDHTTTQFNGFDARFRTRGDLDISNLDNNGVREVALHSVEISSSSGQEAWASTRFPLARLGEIQQYLTSARQMIQKAKENK